MEVDIYRIYTYIFTYSVIYVGGNRTSGQTGSGVETDEFRGGICARVDGGKKGSEVVNLKKKKKTSTDLAPIYRYYKYYIKEGVGEGEKQKYPTFHSPEARTVRFVAVRFIELNSRRRRRTPLRGAKKKKT